MAAASAEAETGHKNHLHCFRVSNGKPGHDGHVVFSAESEFLLSSWLEAAGDAIAVAVASAAASDAPPGLTVDSFTPGDRVHHPARGDGTVQAGHEGQHHLLYVLFDSGGPLKP